MCHKFKGDKTKQFYEGHTLTKAKLPTFFFFLEFQFDQMTLVSVTPFIKTNPSFTNKAVILPLDNILVGLYLEVSLLTNIFQFNFL